MTIRISKHHEDPWADEITLNGMRGLRLVTRERWKESYLSGDEWRYSYAWELFGVNGWKPFHGTFSSQDAAIANLYPALVESHPEWRDCPNYSIQYQWKGRKLIEMSNDGRPTTLFDAVGALAWSTILAPGQADWRVREGGQVCAQPGCQNAPTVLYRKIADYWEYIGKVKEHYDGQLYRRFCNKHKHRGDCGLDDADRNYELVEPS